MCSVKPSPVFPMKPILMSSEIDDSRPTVIRVYSKAPTKISFVRGNSERMKILLKNVRKVYNPK